MKTHILDDRYQETVLISGSNGQWTLTKDASISVTADGSDAIFEKARRHNNVIDIEGSARGEFYGLDLTGTGTDVTIGKQGSVSAAFGVVLYGNDQTLTNGGRINGGTIGLVISGDRIHAVNNGDINGDLTAVEIRGDIGTVFENGKKGFLHGEDNAIEITADAGERTLAKNHGTIETNGTFAYQGGDSNDKLVSDGKFTGGISMGNGDDVADMRGTEGHIVVFGGNGSDVLITDNSEIGFGEFSTGTGNDLVKASVSYTLLLNIEGLTLTGKKDIDGTGNDSINEMHGNKGNNVLSGMGGDDDLIGMAGNDRLAGGAGSDYFYFRAGFDHDNVLDFTIDLDHVVIQQFADMTNFAQMLDHASDATGGVIISDGSDSLQLQNVTKAQLHEGDFIFA